MSHRGRSLLPWHVAPPLKFLERGVYDAVRRPASAVPPRAYPGIAQQLLTRFSCPVEGRIGWRRWLPVCCDTPRSSPRQNSGVSRGRPRWPTPSRRWTKVRTLLPLSSRPQFEHLQPDCVGRFADQRLQACLRASRGALFASGFPLRHGSVSTIGRTPPVRGRRSRSAPVACSAVVGTHRSPGRRPVRFAIRASIRGPISSSSWNANTKSAQPARDSVRWEPD